jgi:uncharacterized membrane protein
MATDLYRHSKKKCCLINCYPASKLNLTGHIAAIYLLIFGGTTGVIELGYLVESILVALIILLVLAVLTKILLKNKEQLRESLVSKLSVFPIIFLSLAIAAIFA